MTKNTTLSIKIDTKEPMELKEVMRYLDAIEKEYASYCKNNKNKLELVEGENGKLEIVKLEKGSWVIELMATATAMATTSQSHGINPILGFQEYLTAAIILLAKMRGNKDFLSKIPSITLTLKNCFNLIIILSFKNNINLDNNTDESVNKFFSSAETEDALEGAVEYRERLLEKKAKAKSVTKVKVERINNQLFYWDTVSFSKSEVLDKGVIKKLDEKAHEVTFRDDGIKKDMVKFNAEFEKAWQDLLYVVDVEVTKKGGKIKSYKIIGIHPDETDEK